MLYKMFITIIQKCIPSEPERNYLYVHIIVVRLLETHYYIIYIYQNSKTADNKYEFIFYFDDFSTIISNYFISYYIIARHKVFSMSNTKHYIQISTGILYYVTEEGGPDSLKS